MNLLPRSLSILRLVPFAMMLLPGIGIADPSAAPMERDRFGVPHLRGKSAAEVAYALGRAQCEDRHPMVVQNLYAGAGRLAELLGESALEADRTQRMLRHLEAAERDWPRLPPALRAYLEAFTAGINDWLKEHPQPLPVMRFTPRHVLAAQRQTLMSGALALVRAEGDAEAGDAAPDVPPGKSNSWAVSGRKSATGKPMLLIDPHWPIEGPLQLYEARLQAGALDVWGFMPVGTPLVGLGATPGVAWTFTAGGADSSDAFALRLKPGEPTQYEWDGQWTPMESRRETFRVREGQGWREVAAEFRYTRHGPVLVNSCGEPFAARLPGWDEGRAMEQLWRMNHARSTREFKSALALDQLSYFNLVWAARDGDIGYVQLGQAPRRPPGFDWTRRVPGWTSAVWDTARVPVRALPAVQNPPSGFLQNCNVAANMVTPGLTMKPEDFGPGVLYGHYGAYRARGQRATELLAKAGRLDFDAARAIVFDTYCPPADLWVPVILQAHRDAGEPPDLGDAVKLLREWNRRADRDSAGATLFRFWRLACDAQPDSKAGRDALTIPDAPEVRADALKALWVAVADLHRRYGRLAVPWGDIKRLRRGAQEWPLSGDGLDHLGLDTLRATTAGGLDQDNKLIITGGQCATALVTWNKDHPVIQAVAGYGQSAQPASPHYADQAPLYAGERLRPVPWTEAELHSSLRSDAMSLDEIERAMAAPPPAHAEEAPFRLVRSYPASEATWAGTAGELYLVAAQRALLVYRKTDPGLTSVREVNRIVVGPEGRIANCQIEGGTLYVSAGARGLLAYRGTHLAHAGAKPVWRGGSGMRVGPISVAGGRVYAALEPGGLAVFDGATGRALGSGLTDERLFGLNVDPTGIVYANTTTSFPEMVVLDAREPSRLRVAARIRNDEYPTSYRFPGSIVGGQLLVAEMNGGVGVYDLADPLRPRLASRFLATGAGAVGRGGRPAGRDPIPRSVACEGTTVVIAAGTRIVRGTLEGNRIVWGRALFEAQLEGNGLLSPQAVFLRVGVVAAPTAVDGVRFFAADGAPLAEVDLPSRIEGLAKVGRMVYATSDADGVWQFDWTATGGPKALKRIALKELSEDLLLHRGHLFVADGIGLGVIDVRHERNPRQVAYWDFPYTAQPDINEGWVEGVGLMDDTLFVACGPGGMAVFDIGTPATPRLLTRMNPGTWGHDITVEPRRKLTVYTGMDKFTLLDVSAPASPRILSSTPANKGRPTQGAAFSPDGMHLVVVAGGLFSVYDIRDPATPKLLTDQPYGGQEGALFFRGYLLVSGRDAGTTVWKIGATPADLTLVQTLPSRFYNSKFWVEGDRVFTNGEGLDEYRFVGEGLEAMAGHFAREPSTPAAMAHPVEGTRASSQRPEHPTILYHQKGQRL